jgi:hypothetical protein
LAEVWPGRRLFYLMNEPAAAVEQVWGRSGPPSRARDDGSEKVNAALAVLLPIGVLAKPTA